MYTRSPAAYEGLKSFKLLQLPSVRTLKHYVCANLEDAGECMDRLEQERRQYLVMVEEKRRALERKGKKEESIRYCIDSVTVKPRTLLCNYPYIAVSLKKP